MLLSLSKGCSIFDCIERGTDLQNEIFGRVQDLEKCEKMWRWVMVVPKDRKRGSEKNPSPTIYN